MIPESLIGLVVARYHEHDGSPTEHQAHLVESEIEGRVVTNCGRQLERVSGDGPDRAFLADVTAPGARRVPICDQCRPHIELRIVELLEGAE